MSNGFYRIMLGVDDEITDYLKPYDHVSQNHINNSIQESPNECLESGSGI